MTRSINVQQTFVQNNYILGGGFAGAPTGAAAQANSPEALLTSITDILKQQLDQLQTGLFNPAFQNFDPVLSSPPAPVETPIIEDSAQPAGSLKAEGNKVTTPGGYTVEVLGTSEWKITGPDGKSTRIWGDPHVHESDAGDSEANGGWDFKRNSTFALPDGTRINVTTVPGGAAGATVTGKLEIISGNDRVVADNMEKGKSNFGTVTQDGFAHANSFQGDVFVMGKESDDWSFQGKEIIGSEGMGEKFKTGGTLEAGNTTTTRGTDTIRGNPNQRRLDDVLARYRDTFMNFGRNLMNLFQNNFRPSSLGSNPYTGNTRAPWESDNRYDRGAHRRNLTQSLNQMSRMFNVLAQLSQLNDRFQALRDRFYANQQG